MRPCVSVAKIWDANLAPQNGEEPATLPLHSQSPSFHAPCAFSRNLPDDKLDQVRDEIGDIPIYLANLSEKFGIDPVQAAHDKIEKNQIKYPAEIVRGKHSKYSEYD